MRYELQKNWVAEHPKNGWEWVLYVKDNKWDDHESAASIFSTDRDGPFSIAVWDWIEHEYAEYEGFKRLQDAKTMGKLLANMMFVKFPHDDKQNF